MQQKRFILMALLTVILVLTACTTPAAPAPTVEEPAPAATEAPAEEPAAEATAAPAEEPAAATDHTGAWVDEVVVVEEPSASAAVSRLNAGELDIYAYAVSEADVFEVVQNSPDLTFSNSFGSYNELTLNPSGPVLNNGKLNPFADPQLREAVNWLVDRNYIVQEIFEGLAVPKYFPINSAFPDYARVIDVARQVELQYAPDPERAAQVISERMVALGAEEVDGQWQYEGEPVELLFLIRSEDERQEIGDYVATLFEDLGFTVTRDYRTSAEASPIWNGTDPAEGQWHVYTGGWVTTAISRDQASNFDFFYTNRGLNSPLWQAYTPSEEFDTLANALANSEFTDLDQRKEMFGDALALAMQDSVRVWLVDRLSFSPYKADITVASDLAGGIYGSWLWPHTLNRGGETGGSVTIAMPAILNDPWNPVNGSNFIYDTMLIRSTSDQDVMPDPYTGLFWPQRIERAEVTIKEGLPVGSSHDWVTLDFAPEITVPEDAWVDWDATEQRFITVGEKFPEGLTANRRSITYYPEDFFDIKWHDGSTMSMGDLILGFILGFDQGKEGSPIFDEAQVPSVENFLETFRGLRIVQQDPLVVEFYSDLYFLDAEWNVAGLYPHLLRGPGPWHTVATGFLAASDDELAFSADQAEALGVEWMSYIAGPSLEILAQNMEEGAAENFIPYANTLSQYISAEEATERWANLQAWYADKGHFWVGAGPMILEEAFPVEGTVQLVRNPDYLDASDKWARFQTPMLATTEVDGPGRVTIGTEAVFDVFIDFEAEPYPMDMIETVTYLVFDATGALAFSGEATAVDNGLWEVVLTAEQTAELEAGANRLEIAVAAIPVSLPSFASLEFVTVP